MSITFQILFYIAVIYIVYLALKTAWEDHLEAKELKRLNRAHAYAEEIVHKRWSRGAYAGADIKKYHQDYENLKTIYLAMN